MSNTYIYRYIYIYTCRVFHRILDRSVICNMICSFVYLCRVSWGCTPNDLLITPFRRSFDAHFCMDPFQYRVVLSKIGLRSMFYPCCLKLLDISGQIITTSLRPHCDLTEIMDHKGNHPKMAKHFRLVN